jgi:hypothetical protein
MPCSFTAIKMSKTNKPIYQIKVSLQGSKPPVWRRLLVSSDTSLSQLHQIIQTAMGWWDSHLHQFIVGDVYYGVPSPDAWYEVKDEHRAKLNQIAPQEKAKFVYEYDFGDDWRHAILVEKILPPDPAKKLPVCIKGKHACPPEDVGGIWGYETFLEAIADPEHEEHDSYLEWVGGAFDPASFDIDAINEQLRQL